MMHSWRNWRDNNTDIGQSKVRRKGEACSSTNPIHEERINIDYLWIHFLNTSEEREREWWRKESETEDVTRESERLSHPGSGQRLRVTWPGGSLDTGHYLASPGSQAEAGPWHGDMHWRMEAETIDGLSCGWACLMCPLVMLTCSVSSVSASPVLLSCREKAASPRPPPRPGRLLRMFGEAGARPGRPQWAQLVCSALGPVCCSPLWVYSCVRESWLRAEPSAGWQCRPPMSLAACLPLSWDTALADAVLDTVGAT